MPKCENGGMPRCRNGGTISRLHIYRRKSTGTFSRGFLLHVADFFIGTVMEGWRH